MRFSLPNLNLNFLIFHINGMQNIFWEKSNRFIHYSELICEFLHSYALLVTLSGSIILFFLFCSHLVDYSGFITLLLCCMEGKLQDVVWNYLFIKKCLSCAGMLSSFRSLLFFHEFTWKDSEYFWSLRQLINLYCAVKLFVLHCCILSKLCRSM